MIVKKTRSSKKIVLKITMSMTKTKLEKRVAGIEGMVANLIVDQQAMTTLFNTRGDRHSGSLDRHRANLTALGSSRKRRKPTSTPWQRSVPSSVHR